MNSPSWHSVASLYLNSESILTGRLIHTHTHTHITHTHTRTHKVKQSHTQLQALGAELIQVSSQSAHR